MKRAMLMFSKQGVITVDEFYVTIEK